MGSLWLKLKIWTKIILIALAIVYVFAFLLMNSGQSVKQLWIFPYKAYTDVSALILTFLAFGIGVVGTLLVAMGFRTARQVREMRDRSRAQRLEREVADMKSKAARLQMRPEEKPKTEEPET